MDSGTSTSRAATMQKKVPPSGYIGDRETDKARASEEITAGRSRSGGVAKNDIIPAESIILMPCTSIVTARATESGAPSAELSIQAYPSEGSADETPGGGIAAGVEPLFDPASSTVIPDQTSCANDFSRALACAEERPCEGIGAEQAKVQPTELTASAAAMTATDEDILDVNEYLKTIPTRYMRDKIRPQSQETG
ncbi:hypothetical protein GN958_ATG01122 [Phytophthora infestans]|uniref:Uncharacterized protein n=1 Tax=Phytophthora infestans TaxID=4787 RepID=A0A8S9V8F2_PHYIN|nr:hypothetical protein GN958_ATG01122 [Phytophthora infestans]